MSDLRCVCRRALRAADVHACVSGLFEEDGVHPQHPLGEEGEGPETGAAPRRSDGGETRLLQLSPVFMQ